MNSKLLKLDAPYNVIYAGGKVGRHIATLMVWNDDEEAANGIMDSASYPVIDEGEEFPAGTLCSDVELHDCRVICPPGGTNLYWVAKMIEYDFQQMEPAGAEYILERMKLLDCTIKMPEKLKFDATLSIWPAGKTKGNRIYRVKSNPHEGFYFESEGTADEIKNDLQFQLSIYEGAFRDDLISICFQSHDLGLPGDEEMENVLKYLNDIQGVNDGEDADRD